MGKYATYRKRGSYTEAVSLLGPPPAPTLADEEEHLVSRPTGLPDIGGSLLFYTCDFDGSNRVFQLNAEWVNPKIWATLEELEEGYYVVTELGNGVVYVGESEGSPIFHYEP